MRYEVKLTSQAIEQIEEIVQYICELPKSKDLGLLAS